MSTMLGFALLLGGFSAILWGLAEWGRRAPALSAWSEEYFDVTRKLCAAGVGLAVVIAVVDLL